MDTLLLWPSRREAGMVYGEPEFAEDSTVKEYERQLADLERLLGKKEVEIAALKNFLGRSA